MTKKKHLWKPFDWSLEPKKQIAGGPGHDKPETNSFQTALRQIGITDCPICKHEIAVFLTKSSRPFINCSFCSVRIFYNGRESQRRLKRNMQAVEES